MNNIKSFFFERFNSIFFLITSLLLSVGLLAIRIKFTNSFVFIFLLWNLFLAMVPFFITCYLKSINTIRKSQLILCFFIWLLFLPNAPYILTDMLHIKISPYHLLWLDVLIITSFSYNGLLLFYITILDMESLLKQTFKNLNTNYATAIICLLTGFGIYLGRFLRYNSWDILQNPKALIYDIFHIIFQPQYHTKAWIFSIGLSIFLGLGLKHIKALIKS